MDKTESSSSFNPAINADGGEEQQPDQLLKRLSTRKSASYFSSNVLGDDTLTVDDIKLAQKVLHDKHPLEHIGVSDVFPFFGSLNCMAGCFEKIEEQQRKIQHQVHQEDSDVSHFDSLGSTRQLDHLDFESSPEVSAAQYDRNTDHVDSLKLLLALGDKQKQKETLEPLLGNSSSDELPKENQLSIKLRNAMLNKAASLQKVKEEQDTDVDSDFKDIFYEYGYGVIGFFKILKSLIFVLTIVSLIVALPPLFTFYKLKINPNEVIESTNSYFSTTMGVMGAAGSQKFIVPFYSNRLKLFCENSQIGPDSQFGIIALNQTQDQKYISYTGYSLPQSQKDNYLITVRDECHGVLNKAMLQREFNNTCIGKSRCELKNISQMYLPNLSDDLMSSCGPQDKVTTKQTLIFAQIGCVIPEDQLQTRRLTVFGFSCLGIFGCLLFWVILYFRLSGNQIDYKKWDMETITINDFSVELKIKKELWGLFEKQQERIQSAVTNLEDLDKSVSNITRAEHFHQFLKNFILNRLRVYAREKSPENLGKLQIALIELDFNRTNLLLQLAKRGQAIKKKEFDEKKPQIEEQIASQFKEEPFQRPMAAFITFEYPQAVNLVVEMFSQEEKQEEDKDLNIHAEEATMPTNIKWEMRHRNKKEGNIQLCKTYSLIAVIMIVIIMIVFTIRYQVNRLVTPFKQIQCNRILNQVQKQTRDQVDITFKKSPSSYDSIWGDRSDVYELSLVSCFCQAVHQNHTTLRYLPKVDQQLLTDVESLMLDWEDSARTGTTKQIEDTLMYDQCLNLSGVENQIWLFQQIVNNSILVVNFALRFLVIWLIKKLGYKTISEETRIITKFMFIIQFLNTGPILVMINADITQIIVFDFWDEGRYTDFTVNWYKDVGGIIISTMIFNIGYPIVEFFIFYGMRFIKRLIDSGYTLNKQNTKQKLIIDYVDLYSGPEYVIHYKYSFILNVVFMTFMFGAGLPILFPLAVCSLTVLYIMERLQAAYSYQKPPMMDASLNSTVIKMLFGAPLFYASFGFWMYNNPGFFRNDRIMFTQDYNQHQSTGHYLAMMTDYFVDQSFPLFFFFVISFVAFITKRSWTRYLAKKYGMGVGSLISVKTEEISFYEALTAKQRKMIVNSERHNRKLLNFKKVDNTVIDKIRNREQLKKDKKKTKKRLIGLASYNILDNHQYQIAFQYVPPHIEETHHEGHDHEEEEEQEGGADEMAEFAQDALSQSKYVLEQMSTFYTQK